MGYLKWGGKKFYPQKSKPYTPDINELMKPLSEKVGKGNIWGSQVMNVLKVDPTPTPTPSVTPTLTPTQTVTPTPSITPTSTVTPTPSVTPTLTPTQTVTPTPSITPTSTVTPTPSVTPTLTPTSTVTPTPTNTPTPSSSPIPSGTTEANAYLSAVVDGGGTGITPTISAATVTLFTSLVSNGLYSKMLAMYPLIGGVANASKLNAVNVGTYDITWNGGMSFTTTGATGNGTNAFGNTGIDFTAGSPNLGDTYFVSGTYGAQFHQMPASLGTFIGAGPAVNNGRYFLLADSTNVGMNWGSSTSNYSEIVITTPDATIGLYIINSIGAGGGVQSKMFKNGVNLANGGAATRTNYPGPLYLFRREDGFYYDGTQSFAFVASYMSDAEVSTLSSIINTYQTSLGRNLY